MKRTTIFLDEQVEAELRALAQRQRRPVAAVVRDALVGHLAEQEAGYGLRLSFVAAGRSGRHDTAERHEELVFAAAEPRLQPSRRRGRGRKR